MTVPHTSPPGFRLAPLLLRLRHRVEWALLAGCLALVRLLPERAMVRAMGKAWRLIGPLNGRHARARANLALALPELSAADRERLARDMWENLGRIAGETLQLDRITRDASRFEIDVEAVRTAVGARGAVVVAPHAGNWEVTVLGGLACGWAPVGVYKALNNPLSDRLLRRLRVPLYPGGLLPKGHDTARRLLSDLRKGARVALLADLRDVRGTRVPFFGTPAHATTFPAQLACAAGVPLVAARVVRLPGDRFRIEAEVIDLPRTGDRKADAEALTRRTHEVFERWIREHPAQWMWIMRKWT